MKIMQNVKVNSQEKYLFTSREFFRLPGGVLESLSLDFSSSFKTPNMEYYDVVYPCKVNMSIGKNPECQNPEVKTLAVSLLVTEVW